MIESDAFKKNDIIQKLKSITDEEIQKTQKTLLGSRQAKTTQKSTVWGMEIFHDQQKSVKPKKILFKSNTNTHITAQYIKLLNKSATTLFGIVWRQPE